MTCCTASSTNQARFYLLQGNGTAYKTTKHCAHSCLLTFKPDAAWSCTSAGTNLGLLYAFMLLHSARNWHLPLVSLVYADGSLVMQVADSADSSTPPPPLHFSPGCCCHGLPEIWLSDQLVRLLNGLLIITWRIQKTCTRSASQA